MKRNTILLTSVLLATVSVACAGPNSPTPAAPAPAAATSSAPLSSATDASPRSVAASARAEASASNDAQVLPLVLVHKSPTCGCCGLWVEHMRSAGFQVEVRDSDDLSPIKQRLGVPADKASCHTAQVGDYFVEGHVPADDVKRLLLESPDARGIAVPGMPLGSPGMEGPVGSAQPYSVELIGKDGSSTGFASH